MSKRAASHEQAGSVAAPRQSDRHACHSTLEVPAMCSNALSHPVRQGSNAGTGIKVLQQLYGQLALLVPAQPLLPHLPLPLPLHVAKHAIVQGIQVWGLGWQGHHVDVLAVGERREGCTGVDRVSVMHEVETARQPPASPVHPLPQQIVCHYVSIAPAAPSILPTGSAHHNRRVCCAKARVAQVHHNGGVPHPHKHTQLG